MKLLKNTVGMHGYNLSDDRSHKVEYIDPIVAIGHSVSTFVSMDDPRTPPGYGPGQPVLWGSNEPPSPQLGC